MVKRILDCFRSDFEAMSKEDLIESIIAAEGRTILGQCFVEGQLVWGVTNPEVAAALGSDLIELNGYNVQKPNIRGLPEGSTVADVKKLVGRPVGVYLECPDPKAKMVGERHPPAPGRIATRENVKKVAEQGADFLVLGGNPYSGASHSSVNEALKIAVDEVGDKLVIFAGKWEDGVIGEMSWEMTTPEVIKKLIDLGADGIHLPVPGMRPGMTIEKVTGFVELAHKHKKNTLVMNILDASQEGADLDTIKRLAIYSKMTGADVHFIGDAGYQGIALPENITAWSIAIRGVIKTYFRMAASYAR